MSHTTRPADAPFVVEIVETITHTITIDQDFLDELTPTQRQENLTSLDESTPLGEAIIDAFVAGDFGSEEATFNSCDDRILRLHTHSPDRYRRYELL